MNDWPGARLAQGSYASWKRGQVIEFEVQLSRQWTLLKIVVVFYNRPWEVLELEGNFSGPRKIMKIVVIFNNRPWEVLELEGNFSGPRKIM